MPEPSSHGSGLQNCRLRSLRLFVLTSCIALSNFSAGESAGEIRCAQAGGATGRGARRELEAGVETDLGLCRARVSREQEFCAAAGAAESSRLFPGVWCS
jgi:hypothetical protein